MYVLGVLEGPNLPSSVKHVGYKLSVFGRSNSGKSCFVSYLVGRKTETPTPSKSGGGGIAVHNIMWPAKVNNQLVIFKLNFWDSSELALRKYSHIQPVSINKYPFCHNPIYC